jgi:hypothetical protein
MTATTARCDQYRAGMRCVRNQHGEEIAHRNRHGSEWGGPEMIPAARWQALKDYLTETRADAAELARANQFDLTIGAAFEAQVEILACTQAKMDELEQS